MSDLHIFIGNGGDDYVIAHDEDDASACVMELVGAEHMYWIDWVQWPDDTVLCFTHVDEPGHPKEARLPEEWAEVYGRGWLGGNP